MDQRLVDALEALAARLGDERVGPDSLDASLLRETEALAAMADLIDVALATRLAEIDRRALSEADCGMRQRRGLAT